MAIRADVSREDEVQAMFRKMFDAFGNPHPREQRRAAEGHPVRRHDALPGVPPVTVACSRSDDHWRRERLSRDPQPGGEA